MRKSRKVIGAAVFGPYSAPGRLSIQHDIEAAEELSQLNRSIDDFSATEIITKDQMPNQNDSSPPFTISTKITEVKK